MAWSTSAGNRGYIFLISAMKVIYLCVTSSYCFSFIASFLTGLVQMVIFHGKFNGCNFTDITCPSSNGFVDAESISSMNWMSYGIYAFFVIVITVVAYLQQKDKEPHKIYEYKQVPKLFFQCALASLVLMIFGLLGIALSDGLQ